jgi:anthranilate/para-aminobenzoate synthase component II
MTSSNAPPADGVDVFMLDCYDSFTYNLVQVRLRACRSDVRAGERCIRYSSCLSSFVLCST